MIASNDPRREDPAQNERPAGSPSSGEPVYLVIGKLRRPHGVRGEMIMDVYSDFPERIRSDMKVFVGEEFTPIKIRSVRQHNKGLLVSFEGYYVPETVGELRNAMVYVLAEDLPPLTEGEYYHHDIIGLRVVDEEGRELGRVSEILQTPANDVYVVQPESGSEVLLPAVEDVILDIDLDKGEIRVHPLPGLLPD